MATSAGSQHRCVFVGNIPYDATEEQLIQICEEVGPVVSFRLVVDRETGKPKGYGFCEYKDEETALSARRNLQGYEINGRQLRVDFAENDKRADRSREQGRGGPGLTSSSDAQKALPGASIPVDSALHQPVGHQLAATAASVMARTLGGAQTSNLPLIQNGLRNPSGAGNDPLTQYLAKMSRQQLNEIMSEMKALVAQNKPLAQQLLQRSPQLSKALFQAEIMLGLVTPPQLIHMANTQQPSSSVPQPGIQNNISNQSPLLPFQQKEALVGPLTRPPELNMPNPVIPPHSAVPLQHVPIQPQFPQPQILQQGPPIHGNSLIPMHPQPFGNHSNQPQLPPLPISKGLIYQVQPPPLLQHSRPGQHRKPPLPDSLQQSYLPHLPTSQNGSSNHPVLLNGWDSLSKDAGTSGASSHDSAWASRVHKPSTLGVRLTEQTGTAGDMSEVTNHPSKRPRLEDGGAAIGSVPAQSAGSGSVPGSQMVNADAEKQVPQLPPELESALLQQVMNLTPDQLSSLPLEQQQQVLQLQQMLVKQNL